MSFPVHSPHPASLRKAAKVPPHSFPTVGAEVTVPHQGPVLTQNPKGAESSSISGATVRASSTHGRYEGAAWQRNTQWVQPGEHRALETTYRNPRGSSIKLKARSRSACSNSVNQKAKEDRAAVRDVQDLSSLSLPQILWQ